MLFRSRPDVRPFFVGSQRGIEARVLAERRVEHELLPVVGFARGALLSNWRVVPGLGRSLARVVELFRALAPELVVVTGGYASGPSGLVAALARVPLAVQEQNSVPGFTTTLLSRWASQIHLAFPEAASRLPAPARDRVRVEGNPIQPPRAIERDQIGRAHV